MGRTLVATHPGRYPKQFKQGTIQAVRQNDDPVVKTITPKLGVSQTVPDAKNVLGTSLQTCSLAPRTGFFRDGCCRTGAEDMGLHLVCAEMTKEFLEYSRDQGNDLITAVPAFQFPGLKPGDRWCLCVQRWKEAFEAGIAPRIVLESTHISTLEFVDMSDLEEHAVPSEL